MKKNDTKENSTQRVLHGGNSISTVEIRRLHSLTSSTSSMAIYEDSGDHRSFSYKPAVDH